MRVLSGHEPKSRPHVVSNPQKASDGTLPYWKLAVRSIPSWTDVSSLTSPKLVGWPAMKNATLQQVSSSIQDTSPCKLLCIQWFIWRWGDSSSRAWLLYIYTLVPAAPLIASLTTLSLSHNQLLNPTSVAPMEISIFVSRTIVRCAGNHPGHTTAQLAAYAVSDSIITVHG